MKFCLLATCGLLAGACQPQPAEHHQPIATSSARPPAPATPPTAQPGSTRNSPPRGAARAPGPRFSQARTSSLYAGKLANIDYHSHSIARRYRTVLTAGYREGGVNFGGHYRLVTWMCGASCTQSALVDARTGRVYEGPIAALGFNFRADSRLLVVNPPDSSGFDTSLFPPEYWVWHEAHRIFERP